MAKEKEAQLIKFINRGTIILLLKTQTRKKTSHQLSRFKQLNLGWKSDPEETRTELFLPLCIRKDVSVVLSTFISVSRQRKLI